MRDTIWPEFALVDPSNMSMRKFIENTVKGIDKDNERLGNSVKEFIEMLLIPINNCIVKSNLSPEQQKRLQYCFKDIYISLKVHVMFYRRIDRLVGEKHETIDHKQVPKI